VYAALVNFSGKMYPAMFHFGVRSTDNTISAEVHLLDVNLDLLDREITITPIKFIRDVGEFQDLQDLKKQLALDLVQIVKYV
jgi:FAD synthase